MVQALERITPQSGNDAFVDALELLKHAVSVCPELGDAWYYRSLVEKRLGHDALAKYALGKAQFNGSEALDQGLNPLELSTPASRGAAEPGPAPGPAAPPVLPGPVQQKWALVVGIGHFTDTEIPRLNYTTADATAFAAALEDPSIGQFPADNVHVLTDEQATTKNIKEQLNWIARHAAANDLVVIYVATHGTPRTIDTAGGANYLVTYDTEAYNGKQFNEDALYATAYPMVELANAVATRMKALRTVVFLDTCYSGAAAGPNAPAATEKLANTAPSQAMLAHMSLGTGRIVMSASQSDEAVARKQPASPRLLYVLSAAGAEKWQRHDAAEPGLCLRGAAGLAKRLRSGQASASGHEPQLCGCGFRAALAGNERSQRAALTSTREARHETPQNDWFRDLLLRRSRCRRLLARKPHRSKTPSPSRSRSWRRRARATTCARSSPS